MAICRALVEAEKPADHRKLKNKTSGWSNIFMSYGIKSHGLRYLVDNGK